MANTYLTRTTSTAGNGKTFTFSTWLKRSENNTSEDPCLFCIGAGNSSQADQFFFGFNDGGSSTDKLSIQQYSGVPAIRTNKKFRDVNAWYHIVLTVDTTQSTASNRLKIFVNGVQETDLAAANYPTQNYSYALGLGTSKIFVVGGAYFSSFARYLNGSMSHVHYIDGTAYDASYFGETDATTGEWKIKTSPSVTYGTNGFFILKDGNSVTDSSPNSNNFTVGGGTLTKTEDCPSNVFATLNPLDNFYAGGTFINGNNTITTSNSTNNVTPLISTLGMSSGKYYAEIKYSARTGADDYARIGVCASNASRPVNEGFEGMITDHSYQGSDGAYSNNDTHNAGYGATYTVGDIIGISLDLDNGYIYFSKNGTYQNSGVPTSGSTGTGGKTVSLGVDYFFGVADIDYNDSYTFQCNFGNGYFGTTAVSSAGTNASGIGIFEYDVPTGYTALSTKGLNL